MDKKPFWKKYFLTCVGFILILVTILMVTFINFYYNKQKMTIKTNADDILYFAENSLNQRLGTIEERIGGIVMARNFAFARQNDDLGQAVSSYNTKSLLESIYAENNEILAIFYSNDKGNYSAGENLGLISERLKIIEEKQATETFKNNRSVWFYKKMTKGFDACVLYREIIYIDSDYQKQKLGDILVYVDASRIVEENFSENKESTGVIFLDSDGIITISTNAELMGKKFNEYFNVSGDSFSDGKNKKYFYTEFPTNISEWKKISYFKQGYVFEMLWKTIGGILVVTLLSILIMLVVFYYITQGITKPVEELFSYIKVSDKGEILIDAGKSDGEVEEIKEIFDRVVFELKKQIRANYISEIERKNALIKSYEYQMNPHFLYNTLQIIQMLNATGRKDDVNYSISYLGKVLRFNLKSKNKVTLKEELENIQNYFAILKYRYRDKFDYKIMVEEELYPCSVIKFLLQPFVENSINHGFKNKTDLWEICIVAVKVEDDLAIIIRDNGIGIEKEHLKEIKERLKDVNSSETGIGISNVNSRIKLSYGTQYGVDIFSGENSTQVLIHIPCIFTDKKEDSDV